MKIQSLNRLSNPRAAKLFRASFIYLVLFAIGITVYVSEVRDAGGQSFLDKILGTYTSNVKEERKGQLTKVKETLDDYATLKTEDDANLASCDTKVLSVKYNNANNCSSAACKDKAEDAELYGWTSLYKCQDRPNKNIGCQNDYYVGGTVDAIKVSNIPLLNFLASIDPIDQSEDINENDPFSYTQPYCFYNMFRNFENTTRENPLSFGTNIEGPLYFNISSKLAVIKYDKLGTGAQCWGINWDDYTNIANFDIKAFLKQYWVNQNSDYNQSEQPDTWWSFILNFFKKKYNASMASLFNGNDIKSVSSVYNDGTQSLCQDIPGGAVTNLFETQGNDSGSNKEYELTRQVKEFSKPEICDMYLSGDSNLRGVSGCTIGTGSNSFTITTGNRGTEFNRLKYKTEIILGKKVVTSYCDAKPLCGFDWQCKEESYEDVYNYCKQNHSNIASVNGTNIRYKIETEPISYVNFPNGLTLLKHVYNLEQQLASPYIINYGQNNGIRINVTRTLYDVNNCGSNCSYGSSLDYRAGNLNDDYVEGLVDSLDSGLTEYINVEQNNPYSADLINKGGMQAIVSRGNDLALTEVNLDYIFPHLGDVPRILERISVYFSNQANEDTASTLVEWLFNRLPLPNLRNNNLGDVVLKLCGNEGDGDDCFDKDAIYTPIENDDSPTKFNVQGMGIDVSQHNGNINWEKVADPSQGVNFVIIRAGYTGYGSKQTEKDTAFERNWSGAGSVGLKRSAYYYFIGDAPGVAQADGFIDIIESVGGSPSNIDLPLSIDVETLNNTGIDINVFSDNLEKMVRRMEARGYKPMIYTNNSAWTALTNIPQWANDDYDLWLAAWLSPGSDPSTSQPASSAIPQYWTKWKVWQFSGDSPNSLHLMIDGINSIVDGNLANPNAADLALIMKKTGVVLGVTSGSAYLRTDSLGTYIRSRVYRANNKTLIEDEFVDSNDESSDVDYFVPNPDADADNNNGGSDFDIVPCTNRGNEWDINVPGVTVTYDRLPGYLQMTQCYVPNKIVLHWMAGGSGSGVVSSQNYWIYRYENTGVTISCHLGIDYDGRVNQWLHMYDNGVQLEQCVGGADNVGSISIEIAGQYFMMGRSDTHGTTDAQNTSVLNTVCTLMEKYNLPLSSVYGHMETNGGRASGKPDPGAPFMAYVRERISGGYCNSL